MCTDAIEVEPGKEDSYYKIQEAMVEIAHAVTVWSSFDVDVEMLLPLVNNLTLQQLIDVYYRPQRNTNRVRPIWLSYFFYNFMCFRRSE